MSKPNLTLSWDEFVCGAERTDVFKFTERELEEMRESMQEHIAKRNRDWGILANQVVGAENLTENDS